MNQSPMTWKERLAARQRALEDFVARRPEALASDEVAKIWEAQRVLDQAFRGFERKCITDAITKGRLEKCTPDWRSASRHDSRVTRRRTRNGRSITIDI